MIFIPININTLFKSIFFLGELSQNRKKAEKSAPKLKGLGTWWGDT
jgi:hypothetical protein